MDRARNYQRHGRFLSANFHRSAWIWHTYVNTPAKSHVHTYDVTYHFTRHLAKGIDAFLFGSVSLARRFRAVDPLPWKRLAESEKTIHCEPLCVPLSPPPPPPRLPRAFYFTALSVNCRRIGSSTGRPACCAPPGDELLLSRASRSRGLTLFGLSSRERVRPRKVQIAKK